MDKFLSPYSSELIKDRSNVVNISEELSFNRDDQLGSGSYSHVFKGTFKNISPVAVKRIVKLDVTKFEKDIVPTLQIHPNIIRFYGVEQDADFM